MFFLNLNFCFVASKMPESVSCGKYHSHKHTVLSWHICGTQVDRSILCNLTRLSCPGSQPFRHKPDIWRYKVHHCKSICHLQDTSIWKCMLWKERQFGLAHHRLNRDVLMFASREANFLLFQVFQLIQDNCTETVQDTARSSQFNYIPQLLLSQ